MHPALVAHRGSDNARSPRRRIGSSDSDRLVVEAQCIQGVYARHQKCLIRVSRKLVGASLGKDGQLGERTVWLKLITSVRQQ